MRIVFLTTVLDYSGAPKMMAWIANKMVECGYEVKIICLYSHECMQRLNSKVKFESLDLPRSKSRFVRNTFGMIKSVNAVHRAMKMEKPDVIVTFLDSVGYMYMLKNRFSSRYKILASERSDPYSQSGFTGKIRQKLFSLADAIVFQTEGARDFFKNSAKIQKKGVVIPNPIIPKSDIEDRQVIKYTDRDNRIVSVGRLDNRQKRYDIMIDAFKNVHQIHSELSLHIYGDGQDKDKVQAIIENSNLTDCVFLMGRTDNVEGEIYNARAFVMTSDYEGIPNSLIEAMLAGVPSVSTDCSPGGAALLIKDEEDGLIVPRSDSSAVAKALLRIVENEELSDRISKNAPLIEKKFSEEKIAEMWHECFEIVQSKKDS